MSWVRARTVRDDAFLGHKEDEEVFGSRPEFITPFPRSSRAARHDRYVHLNRDCSCIGLQPNLSNNFVACKMVVQVNFSS